MAKGAEFPYDSSDMLAVATKFHGNISAIADHYNVHRDTIYRYLNKDPEGKKIIEHVRGYNTEIELDLAEHIIKYNLSNYKSNAGLAQRAAEKVIDCKGHKRGWISKNKEDIMMNDEEVQKMADFFSHLASSRKGSSLSRNDSDSPQMSDSGDSLRNSADTKISDEAKS